MKYIGEGNAYRRSKNSQVLIKSKNRVQTQLWRVPGMGAEGAKM